MTVRLTTVETDVMADWDERWSSGAEDRRMEKYGDAARNIFLFFYVHRVRI